VWITRSQAVNDGGGVTVYDMRPAGVGDNGRKTEAQLITDVHASDWTAFETIYRAYWPQLVAFARRYGARSKHDAQEIAQDVFFGIWRSRATWDVQNGLEAYLFGAVRNRVVRARRLKLPRLRRPVRTTVDNSGEHRPIVGELTAAIDAIVDAMPDRCRDVYRLRYTDGLNTPAIAKTLNLALATVKRHHARALHLLAQGLAATEWADVARRVLDGTTYGALERDHDDA
jgi:RNA polymerase sigma-70 factor, ECF subfamily